LLSTTIHFDAINALSHPEGVDGATLDSYLSDFGITLSNVTSGTQLKVYDDRNVYSGQAVIAPSAHNLLTQAGSNDPVSFTLNFDAPLDSFGFTRPYLIAGPSGITHPQWDAYAFDSQGNQVDHAGEALLASYSDIPAATYTLHGPGITAVRFDSNNYHFAAFSAVLLDDLVLQCSSSGGGAGGGSSPFIFPGLPNDRGTKANQLDWPQGDGPAPAVMSQHPLWESPEAWLNLPGADLGSRMATRRSHAEELLLDAAENLKPLRRLDLAVLNLLAVNLLL
jgi:hypothetical protein